MHNDPISNFCQHCALFIAKTYFFMQKAYHESELEYLKMCIFYKLDTYTCNQLYKSTLI